MLAGSLAALAIAPLAGSGAGRSTAACITKACRYDIEMVIAFQARDESHRLVATFPNVTLRNGPPRPPLGVVRTALRSEAGRQRILGTVTADVNYSHPACSYSRRFVSPARLTLESDVPLWRPGRRHPGSTFQIAFTSTREFAPDWGESCSLHEGRSLVEVVSGGTAVAAPPRFWELKYGDAWDFGRPAGDPFPSFAGSYYLSYRARQRERTLITPFRQLWNGRSLVIRQRRQLGTVSWEVRVTLTHR